MLSFVVSRLAPRGKVDLTAMASPSLQCRVDEASFADIVRPSGEVDLHTVPILGHALAMAFSRTRHIIVDLSQVTFIDSTGFRELLAHRRIFHENDRLLVLASPQPHVRNVIDRLNFYQVIPVFPSVEIAENLLNKRRAA
jgi:anti-anti-sigma factor